jgi:hypothetical protein
MSARKEPCRHEKGGYVFTGRSKGKHTVFGLIFECISSPFDQEIEQFPCKGCGNNIDIRNIVEDSLFCLYKKIQIRGSLATTYKGKKWATS